MRFSKRTSDFQVFDKEEEEFASLVKEVSSNVSPSDYIDFDMEVATPQSPVDARSITWRQ